MLDEREYALVAKLYNAAFRATREFREEYQLPLVGLGIEERFRPMLDLYEQITGFRETVAAAVMHHRLALYGPPCAVCGKPLRTPRASRCVVCGAAVPSAMQDE